MKCLSRFSHTCMFFVGELIWQKCTFLGIIILIFFACALRHCRVMTGYYVTLKYQAKLRTIAWKVFATLKCLDSTWFCLANMDFRHLFHWENYISKKPPELNAIEANCALKINIFRYFAFFLELTFYFYSLYFFFVHELFQVRTCVPSVQVATPLPHTLLYRYYFFKLFLPLKVAYTTRISK